MSSTSKSIGDILVLGHTGFVGSAISESLVLHGYNVTGASSKECDLLDSVATARFLESLSAGVNVVFSSAILRSSNDSQQTMLNNISMVGNFLAGAPKGRLASLVYLSSTSLYGRNPTLPITEQSLPSPANYYDISKVACEALLTMPGAIDCPVTVLRLPGIYGPGDRGESLVGRFLNQMRAIDSVDIFGDGSTKRDLAAIEDINIVVEGILNKPMNGRLNIATGHSLSVREIVETIASTAGLTPEINYGPPDVSTPKDLEFDTRALNDWLPGLRFTNFSEGCAAYTAARSVSPL